MNAFEDTHVTLADGTVVTIEGLDDTVLFAGLGSAHELEPQDARALGEALIHAANEAEAQMVKDEKLTALQEADHGE